MKQTISPKQLLRRCIARHALPVRKRTIFACIECLEIMEKSADALHDTQHITRMLTELSHLLDANKKVLPLVQKHAEEILFSICVHDTWKAKFQPKNIFSVLWSILWDGIGSVKIAREIGTKYRLESHKIKRVAYAVKMHGMIVLSSRKTFIAKLLYDLDGLDYASTYRIRYWRQFLLQNPRLHWVARQTPTFLSHWWGPRSAKSFFFVWTQKRYHVRSSWAFKYLRII